MVASTYQFEQLFSLMNSNKSPARSRLTARSKKKYKNNINILYKKKTTEYDKEILYNVTFVVK